MEFSSRFIVSAFFTFALLSQNARAYDEYSHEWITRSALDYLRTRPTAYPETADWVAKLGPARGFAEETLVRAVVDTDYRTDMWLGAWFHSPFTGAKTDSLVALFTSLFHFVNVTRAGEYWPHDGYAYKHSTKQGNDSYLDYFSVSVRGDYSTALKGRAPAGDEMHGTSLGAYNKGFFGTANDWKNMFDGASASDAVFPPSTVPAEIAYQLMLKSDRTQTNMTDSWAMDLPLVTGIFSTENLSRSYWRGQVEGLPEAWDLLGMTMHLTQDATVPQHTEGTSDNCHPEYESMIDDIVCGAKSPLDRNRYYDGSYGGPRPGCGLLYDADLVAEIIGEFPGLAPGTSITIEQRIVEVAERSAAWRWETSNGNRFTHLPDGHDYTAKECTGILNEKLVRDQANYQYNFAIAQTVSLFEQAAHDYELSHEYVPSKDSVRPESWFKEN